MGDTQRTPLWHIISQVAIFWEVEVHEKLCGMQQPIYLEIQLAMIPFVFIP